MANIKLFEPNKFYIIRAEKAGVFLAKIESIDQGTVVVNSFRRLYYWSGALDVSQLSAHGVSNPGACKFSVQMGEGDRSVISNMVEFHPASQKAIESLQAVKEWKQ